MREAFNSPCWGIITLDMQYQEYLFEIERDGGIPLEFSDWVLGEGDDIDTLD